MIEHWLFFAAGMFFSALLALLVFPVLWQRALRLSYARLEQALPVSFDETLADQDRIRAEYAVEVAKLERMNAQFTARITQAKAENSALSAEKIKQEEALFMQAEQMRILEADYRRVRDLVDAQRETITALLTLLTLAYIKSPSRVSLSPPVQFDEIPVMRLETDHPAFMQDGDGQQDTLLAPPLALVAPKKRSRKAKVT